MNRARPYAAKARVAQVARQLDDLDRTVVELLGSFKVLSGRQVQRLLYGGSTDFRSRQGRATRRRLSRLAEFDVVQMLERRIGGRGGGSAEAIYCLGLVGQRLVDGRARPRRYQEPGWAFLHHTLAIGEMYVLLVEQARIDEGFEVVTFEPEPVSWRTFTNQAGEAVSLRPDAYTVTKTAGRRSHWFVEVDLATEGRTAIRTKMARYLDYLHTGQEQQRLNGVFPRVLWQTDDPQRRRWLQSQADWLAGPPGLHVTSGLIREPPHAA